MPKTKRTDQPPTQETLEQLRDATVPGVTWSEIAARAGVSDRTLLFWRQKGPEARPYDLTLRAVARALRCDVKRLRRAISASGG